MVIIRQYKDSDLDGVISSYENASKLAHPFLDEDFIAQVKKDIPEKYLPIADTWVVEISGNVVGFISIIGNEVGALFLQPSYHGQGAGKALMDKAVELYGELEVEVFVDNPIGRKFYSQYGFQLLEEKIRSQVWRRQDCLLE